MLPETSTPGAEILPSATVSVECAAGSHDPALVTRVTFQSPSYGVWAMAGATARLAAAMRAELKKTLRMRLWRMNHIPDLCDVTVYRQTMCPKVVASQQHEKFQLKQRFDRGLVPDPEQKSGLSGSNRAREYGFARPIWSRSGKALVEKGWFTKGFPKTGFV
jgi:hypothetical protein